MRKLLWVILFSVPTIHGFSVTGDYDLREAFSRYPTGCITLYDSKTDRYYRYNADVCKHRYLPASTFKIPNAMIALDAGIIDGPDFRMKWDGTVRPVKAWNRDHDLKSAIRNSVVWYFEELARMVGKEKMAEAVAALRYGNARTSGDEPFWLVGDLAISVDEQVEFLRSLHSRTLPICQETMNTVSSLLLMSEQNGTKLYGKTGWTVKKGINIGWFVGWLDLPDGQGVIFATNIRSPDSGGFSKARKAITLDCLGKLGFVDGNFMLR